MNGGSIVELALKRDRLVVGSALLAGVAVSWAYVLAGAGMDIREMAGALAPMHSGVWTAGHAAVVLSMWAIMMAAMMLPSAAPMILFHGTIARRARQAIMRPHPAHSSLF